MFGLNKEEVKILSKLKTPKKIQDFINKIPINFEENGDTCMSPKSVLKTNKAHCIEGALLAAVALRMQGHKPLLLDLSSNDKDYDHVVALFNVDGYWGAISKTNHAILRYREPIYKDIRELAMSYFHEYYNDDGKKTLRSYSDPVDMSKLDNKNWVTSDKDIWFVPEALIKAKHYSILNRKQIANLRLVDDFEKQFVKFVEWKK